MGVHLNDNRERALTLQEREQDEVQRMKPQGTEQAAASSSSSSAAASADRKNVTTDRKNEWLGRTVTEKEEPFAVLLQVMHYDQETELGGPIWSLILDYAKGNPANDLLAAASKAHARLEFMALDCTPPPMPIRCANDLKTTLNHIEEVATNPLFASSPETFVNEWRERTPHQRTARENKALQFVTDFLKGNNYVF